jgi:IS30 family transposase
MGKRRNIDHDRSHLTLNQREIIQTGIEKGSSKSAIAETIGKDASTVAKEIREHRKFKPRNTFATPVLCVLMKECRKKGINKCKSDCERHEEPKCARRDRAPGACNKCPTVQCRMDKWYYNAADAHREYLDKLSSSRQGINITPEEKERIGKTIAPLLNKGQSVHQVMSEHKEIGPSERTIYNYIDMGVFHDEGIDYFSMKEKVNRKKRWTGFTRRRKEPVNYNGRKYSDWLLYTIANPEVPTTEMDTVYNDVSGPYIQTFIFERTGFMIGILHAEKTSASMASTLDDIQDRLGDELYSRLFSLILTDRGVEFEKCDLFESNKSTGTARSRIFYCDPQQSSQKPHVENNHNYVRDIIPNKYPLDGLRQADLDLAFSHINSTPRLSLNDRTPYEMFTFMYGERAAELLNISKIERDDVTLKSSLLAGAWKGKGKTSTGH